MGPWVGETLVETRRLETSVGVKALQTYLDNFPLDPFPMILHYSTSPQ